MLSICVDKTLVDFCQSAPSSVYAYLRIIRKLVPFPWEYYEKIEIYLRSSVAHDGVPCAVCRGPSFF